MNILLVEDDKNICEMVCDFLKSENRYKALENINSNYEEIYLKNNQKDMGIFKHYGYTTSQVYSIYKNNFHTLFFKSFMITEGFSLLFLIFLIKKHIISIVILITLSLLLIIYIVNLLIILRIKYFTEKSTINLLKFSKESE